MNTENSSTPLDKEDESLAEKIMRICTHYRFTPHQHHMNEVALIGEELNESGGPERMRRVYHRAVSLGADASAIQYAWEEFGDWQR